MYTNRFVNSFSEPFYTQINPTPVRQPKLISWSEDAARLVQMEPSDDVVQTLAGNKILSGMKPIATRYGGHQFGHWAGQLGDGRAIILAEKNGYEIQLKGAGLTPYSRSADGRAVLRSSLREYLCSEAMHFLRVPTTRALALVGTGEHVLRDMFYDGNPQFEPGAICTRLSPTFIRFGHFEILAADGDREGLERLLQYVLQFYPGHCPKIFFKELCARTAKLMVEWLRVGFVHGVMNTDNMSILGLTIDYGPYGFLDNYDPSWTPNTTDFHSRRYTYARQPDIALWNLTRLAEAFSVLDLDFSKELQSYREVFFEQWNQMMAAKLGLDKPNMELVQSLDRLLRLQETDMTIFYRELCGLTESGFFSDAPFYEELSSPHREQIEEWLAAWRSELQRNSSEDSRNKMAQTNPAFILRNYLVQQAYEDLLKDQSDFLKRLEVALRTPYELVDPDLCGRRPEWARNKAGCSMLSCSS